MTDAIDRRRFLGAAAAAAGLSAGVARAGEGSPSETVVIGVMGVGGRGMAHTAAFAGLPGVEVAYVCDVDERRAGLAVDAVKEARGKEKDREAKAPKAVGDFRRILDDKAVDAL